MISKRILLVTVCLVVLTIAAGAYGYVLHMEVSSLRSRLKELQRENNQFKYRIAMMRERPLNGYTGVHIGEGNNISTKVVDLMEDYGAQIIFLIETPEYAWFNDSLIIIFDAEWIAEKINDTRLHDFLRNAVPKEVKLVAIGEKTSKFFEALDEAGVYDLPVTETGRVRNPAYFNPPLVGFRMKRAYLSNGYEYLYPSIWIAGTVYVDEVVQHLIDW